MPDTSSNKKRSLSLWAVVSSVLAAAFGVQRSQNAKRDFTRGKAYQFITVGIIGVILLVLLIISIVKLVIKI